MDHEELTAAMDGTPQTNGWDAVCSMNAERTGALFFQQYLADGPTSPTKPLRVIVPAGTGSEFLIVDAVLGPPEISFGKGADDDQAEVRMVLTHGALITIDPDAGTIVSAETLLPNASALSGAVDLKKVAGKVSSVGQVTLDLAANAYAPSIVGVASDSVEATRLGTAIQTFFSHTETDYILGTVIAGDVPAYLTPTDFDIVSQPDPTGATKGCVSLLIQTNGKAGTAGPLSTYPIPSGSTAALVVSNQVIFNQLAPAFLTAEFKKIGTKFQGSGANGVYSAKSHGGTLDLGEFMGDDNLIFSSDQYGDMAKVKIDAGGFTAEASGGKLRFGWNKDFKQYWNKSDIGPWGPTQNVQKLAMKASYDVTAAGTVDAVTDVISFSGKGKASFGTGKHYSFWQKLIGHFDVSSDARKRMVSTLKSIFDKLELPSVNTFALANLVFPSQHALKLDDASLPSDLLATGNVAPSISVLPSSAMIAPGATQQFKATGADGTALTDVLWEVKPRGLGSIDASGLYTAPATIPETEVAVVTAVNAKDSTQSAGAMAVLYTPLARSELIVSPARVAVTPGQSVTLTVTDATGAKVDATLAADPATGTLKKGFMAGTWTYTAPATASAATEVVLTATEGTGTGAATATITPASAVTVTPSTATVGPKGTVTLKASGGDSSGLTWLVYSPGGGTISGSGAGATFTAPDSVAQAAEAMVVAYRVGDTADLGLARISLTP